jgi:hypothetical protein
MFPPVTAPQLENAGHDAQSANNKPVAPCQNKPEIQVDPAEKKWGFHDLTKPARKQIFTIKNTGTADLHISDVTVNGAAQFKISVDAKGKTVAPGGTVPLEVSFGPDKLEKFTAKVAITSDACNTAVVNVSVAGVPFDLKDLKINEFIASGADEETNKITYKIDDDDTLIEKGKLEIFAAKEVGKEPFESTALWSRDLTADEIKKGDREIEWKGKVAGADKGANKYPDEYVSVAHSPYQVKVTVTGVGEDDTETAVFKVEVTRIELAAGPKSLIKGGKMYENVYDEIKQPDAVTSAGYKQKLHLESNRFSSVANDDHADDATSYNLYKNLWGDGPVIPIYATLWVKSTAAGKEVRAPLALGGAKVLWDPVDEKEDTSPLSGHARAKTYVDGALDREKTTSEPPGDNCPSDLGGKRVVKGGAATAVFPVVAKGGDITDSVTAVKVIAAFPYAVTRPSTRKWAAYSEVDKAEADKNKMNMTGAVFQPSRIGGDAYRVVAYVDLAGELDAKGDLKPKSVSAKTGVFQVWRRIKILKIYAKHNIAAHDHAKVKPYYERAYVDLEDASGGAADFDKTTYNTNFLKAINDSTEGTLKPYALIDKTDQYTGSNAPIHVRTRADFETEYGKKFSVAAVNLEVTNDPDGQGYAGLPALQRPNAARLHLAQKALAAAGYTHATNAATANSRYADKCDDFGSSIGMEACNYLRGLIAEEGIVIYIFEWTANVVNDDTDGTRGQAVYAPSGIPNSATTKLASYMQFATHSFYAKKYGNVHDMTRTVSHEIGHLVMLPHTITEERGGVLHSDASDRCAHDRDDDACMMGYNYDVPRDFCGYCGLRLRGWDHTKVGTGVVRPNGTKNGDRDNSQKPGLSPSGPPDFGSPAVAATAKKNLKITNDGKADLVITDMSFGGDNAAEFKVGTPWAGTSLTIAAGANQIFEIEFTPTAAGVRKSTLTIQSNAPGAPHKIAVTSDGKQPKIDVSPTPLDFGDVRAGETKTKQITIKNIGDAPLTLAALPGGMRFGAADADSFNLKNPPANWTDLAVNATQAVDIEYTASAKGPKTATLEIDSNAVNTPGKADLKATCKSPKLTVGAVPAFPAQKVNTTSAQQTITLSNQGNFGWNLKVTALTLGGSNAAEFQLIAPAPLPSVGAPLNIADSGTANVKLTFKPTAAGDRTATLTFESDDPGGNRTVDLKGKGAAPKLTIGAALDFGERQVASASAAQSITLKNDGDAELEITDIGVDLADFALTIPAIAPSVGAPLKIASGAQSAMSFKFTPAAAGVRNGTVTVKSDDPSGDQTVNVKGTGKT